MWIFVYILVICNIQRVGASGFRSRLNEFSRKHELATDINQFDSINRIQRSFRSKCNAPCQLEPYWISFDKVLELSEIPIFLHSFLRSKSEDMIDVGLCSGHCNSSIKRLYSDLNMQTKCVPIEFGEIETEIVDGDRIHNGPTIKNLVIRKCVCTEIHFC